MFEQPRFPRESLIPLLAGIAWLWPSASFGTLGFLGSLPPGCLLVGAGVAMALWPGDHRIDQFAAIGGVLGVLFSFPAYVTEGPATGLWLSAISVASFFAAGWASVRQEPHVHEVPVPTPSLRLAATVAFDEALLPRSNRHAGAVGRRRAPDRARGPRRA
jgi:hypothetical protein